MSDIFNDFFKQNFFALANLLALICGLAYFSGQLQSSVSTQNAALDRVERQVRLFQAVQNETGQNTSDISRIRESQDSERQELMQISGQISGLSQWVKDHRRAVGRGGP